MQKLYPVRNFLNCIKLQKQITKFKQLPHFDKFCDMQKDLGFTVTYGKV